MTVWLTGLPAAGKTTLARALAADFETRGSRVCVLDGDELRTGLSADLGMSRPDRAEQARRVAHVAAIVAASGAISIVALVSPFVADRLRARQIHEEAGIPFFEIWVKTPIEVCAGRDPKGLYARARAGNVIGVTGVDAPYEAPHAADLEVSGCGQSARNAASKIAEQLLASLLPGKGVQSHG